MTAARKQAPKRPEAPRLDTTSRRESNSARHAKIPPNIRSFLDWLVEQAILHHNDP